MLAYQAMWTRCGEQDCEGAEILAGRCLAHLDPAAQANTLAGGGLLDARGVTVDNALLQGIASTSRSVNLDHARFAGPIVLEGEAFGGVSFKHAHFDGEARFDNVIFRGDAEFDSCTFDRDVHFAGARFSGETIFQHARFDGGADFERATFARRATFYAAQFANRADFPRVTFAGAATFRNREKATAPTFAGAACFSQTTFGGTADFGSVTFTGTALFDRTTFSGDAWFADSHFEAACVFSRATFERDAVFMISTCDAAAQFDEASFVAARDFGPIIASRRVSLRDASFLSRATLDVKSPQVSASRLHLPEGGQLRLGAGDAVLDESQFGRPSIVTGNGSTRIVSLVRAEVGNLALANVDLRACRFEGAHNLDRLRLEGTVQLAGTPRNADVPRHPPSVGGWLWTRRRTLAEEHHWRSQDAHEDRAVGWYPPECRPPAWVMEHGDAPAALTPDQLAPLYRALRKGREDASDAPGAADFYYGEMEMRRNADATPTSERVTLTLYWLLSGYGMRATRALIALALLVLAAALALHAWGFTKPQDLASSLLFSIESTTSLLRAPSLALTDAGRAVNIVLRLLGPLLIGLALLSLRGRVKR